MGLKGEFIVTPQGLTKERVAAAYTHVAKEVSRAPGLGYYFSGPSGLHYYGLATESPPKGFLSMLFWRPFETADLQNLLCGLSRELNSKIWFVCLVSSAYDGCWLIEPNGTVSGFVNSEDGTMGFSNTQVLVNNAEPHAQYPELVEDGVIEIAFIQEDVDFWEEHEDDYEELVGQQGKHRRA